MSTSRSVLRLASLILFVSSACFGATITGTVKGKDGAPFQGAFVQAQNTKTRITVSVLSDSRGQYRIQRLPAGEYRVQINAVGFRSDPRTGVNLTADQNASFDFALQTGEVHWSDISVYQGKQLLPPGRGKDILFGDSCSVCHSFQSRMAAVRRDGDGWRDRVQYMRTAMSYILASRVNDQDAADLSAYLTSMFGPDSVLPKSPADVPGYKTTLRPFSKDALNIVYVEYDMPGPSRMPFSAAPDKNGNLWIPNFGNANKITRLDPKTGAMQDFSVPNIGTASIHSAVPGPDGSVWLAEQASNKLGRWDPATREITEYPDTKGSKHTIRLDRSGNVWTTGSPLTKFDPETKKFTRFEEVKDSYDVRQDQNGDIWFTRLFGSKFGKVDGKTIRVVLSTNKIDIGGSDQTPPQVRKTSCTYSKFPCSQISNLNISVNGKKLFVPRSVFADRTDVGTMNLSGADGINVITLVGGDASEGYTVKVFFDGRRVKKRELYSNEANSLDEATTYFRPVVLN